MAIVKILVILGITCLVNTQGVPISASPEENDSQGPELSRDLQAPLNKPADSREDAYSSYFPVRYDVMEPRASDEEESDDDETPITGTPSTVLQPPDVNAPELFSTTQDHELSQEFPVHQFLPLQNKQIKFFDPRFIPTNEKPTKGPFNVENSYYPINPLSKQLDLPLPHPPSQTFAPPPVPARELQLPIYQPFLQIRPTPQNPQENQPEVNQAYYNPLSPNLELPYLTQPKPFKVGNVAKDELIKPKKQNPKVYPKKYNPNIDEPLYKKPGKKIPVIEVGEEYDGNTQINYKKPERLVYKPQQNDAQESGHLESYLKEKEIIDEKRTKFEEAQKKNLLKKEAEEGQQKLFHATRARAAMSTSEPVAAESEFNSFGIGSSFLASPHHQASHQPAPSIGLSEASHHGAGDDRTEFQMHGQHGPHSYKFGYDTGKGKGRQFRYEERDNEGYVKGHYGFYDKHGKLQVVNYDAHPHHGFHAEGSFGRV